jgi:NAD(P)-dependent dehydrogenase (short-subunit alcohol dehydrogenase family)
MGAHLIVLGEKQDEVDQVMSSLEALGSMSHFYGMAADPSNPEDIKIILTVIDRQFHGVDILINNNMFTFPRYYAPPEILTGSFYAKLKGQYNCTMEVLSRMERQSSAGYILNVNTIGSEFRRKYKGLSQRARKAFRTFNAELCEKAADKNVRVMLSSL